MLWGVALTAMYLLLMGMAIGWLAWVVLGKDRSLTKDRKPNWGILLVLGVVGSFVGGLGVSLLAGDGLSIQMSGIVASFLGSLVAVAAYSAFKKRK